MKNTRAMLTVDWDFFVPEDPVIHDFGHEENLMFLDFVWHARKQYIEDIKTTDYASFWPAIQKRNQIVADIVRVSDSHIHAHDIAVESKHNKIVLVDAHHDTWPFTEDENSYNFNCGSWGRIWLKRNPENHIYWIPPEWVKDQYDPEMVEPQVRKQITVLDSIEDLVGFVFPTVHICRSGCWTPPWLDYRFQNFVGRLKSDYVEIVGEDGGDERWNPMKARWSRQDIKAAREENTAEIQRAAEWRAEVESARREREQEERS